MPQMKEDHEDLNPDGRHQHQQEGTEPPLGDCHQDHSKAFGIAADHSQPAAQDNAEDSIGTPHGKRTGELFMTPSPLPRFWLASRTSM